MILYRAMNNTDYINFQESNSIKCNIDSIKLDTTKKRKRFNETHNGKMSLSLDRVIGQINGKGVNTSCWISTSSDFNYVATEYAIPQAGMYNTYPCRKNIIVIVSDEEIDVSNKANRYEQSNKFVGKYINFSNDGLNKLVSSGFIKAYYQNNPQRNLDILKDAENDRAVNVPGINNFANTAKEFLFYREIPRKNILRVLTPLDQDIIYDLTCGKSIEDTNKIVLKYIRTFRDVNYSDYNFTNFEKNIINCIYNKNKAGEFFRQLMEEMDINYSIDNNDKIEIYYCLINLIKLLYEESNILNPSDLYELLKITKKNILEKITGYKINNIVDDSIYAMNYENVVNKVLPDNKPINKSNKHDIIYQVDENKKLIRNHVKKPTKN